MCDLSVERQRTEERYAFDRVPTGYHTHIPALRHKAETYAEPLHLKLISGAIDRAYWPAPRDASEMALQINRVAN